MTSNKEIELVAKFNKHKPDFIKLLGGSVRSVSLTPPSCSYEFFIGKEYCHSIDIVQGGFIAAMLDAAMSHAAYAISEQILGVSTMEMSTRYMAPTHAGKILALGQVISETYRTAFLEGRLHDISGNLTATGHSTVKLTRKKK